MKQEQYLLKRIKKLTVENKNQPAFPRIFQFGASRDNDFENVPGMTKREYFAAMAMQGLIAGKWACPDTSNVSPEAISPLAIMHADALLSELEKQNP